MDIPDHPRVTHAVSVGSEEKIHYTYDMDHGHLFQVWRGEFLDATPMWNSRGDGSSRPIGSLIHLGNPVISLAPLSPEEEQWRSDTTQSNFKPKGYRVNENEELTFLYEAYGTSVEDDISVLENGQGIKREIQIQDVTEGLRAFMLGIYNNMALGLAITGLVAYAVYAWAASDPAVAQTLYGSPLRWVIIFAPLVILTILFGVAPKPVLDMSAASVQQLVNNYNTAVTAVKAAALVGRWLAKLDQPSTAFVLLGYAFSGRWIRGESVPAPPTQIARVVTARFVVSEVVTAVASMAGAEW